MAASLSDASTPRPDGDTFRLDVPPGWRQGRGAFGGLSIAAAVRAIEARVADPRRKVRSVTAELTAPVEAGPAELAVEVLRGGSSVTVARAAPLLYRGTVPVCGDGYFLETRELWGEDGRLVAINQQTFAIIA